MARCAITRPSKLHRLAQITGAPIVRALTRGDTKHRIDAIEPDGTIWHVYRDGTIERSNDARSRPIEFAPATTYQIVCHYRYVH